MLQQAVTCAVHDRLCLLRLALSDGGYSTGGTQDELSPLERRRRQKTKKGSAFEFMQLLTSLTKRW